MHATPRRPRFLLMHKNSSHVFKICPSPQDSFSMKQTVRGVYGKVLPEVFRTTEQRRSEICEIKTEGNNFPH